MKQRDEWPAEWTALVGRAVQQARKEAKVSAAALSERCTELGYYVPRNTITNLENGRKNVIPVHEVVLIALALKVAPIDLLFPLGASETISVTPKKEVTMYEAALWFTGEERLPGGQGLRETGIFPAQPVTQWFALAPSLLDKWRWVYRDLGQWDELRERVRLSLQRVQASLRVGEPSEETERFETMARFDAEQAHRAAVRTFRLIEQMRANGDPTPPFYGPMQEIEDPDHGIPLSPISEGRGLHA